MIWLQHAPGATGGSLASLAGDLARQTNSIVVAPSLPANMNWAVADDPALQAVAALFEGVDRRSSPARWRPAMPATPANSRAGSCSPVIPRAAVS
jgi:hypothetical protein